MNTLCPCCGTHFTRTPEQHWKELCGRCYYVKKQRGLSGLLDLHRTQIQLQLDNDMADTLIRRIDTLRDRLRAAEARATLAESRAIIAETRGFAARTAIPADMLRRLLQLAHPDRHGGSEASQIATRWLLEQRGRT